MKMYLNLWCALLLAVVIAGCGGGGSSNGENSSVSAVSQKTITSFSFINPPATGTIVESAKTIAITVPYGTSVTALVATFTTTGNNVTVGSTVQTSGTTANDFSSPVQYTVTAADGSVATYTLTVTIAPGPSGSNGLWTWMSGANTVNQVGTYGTKGIAAVANVPGGREAAVSWVDRSGNLWLFGGWGFGSVGGSVAYDVLNDLWKFDGSNWTWVSGSTVVKQAGSYGTKGVAAAINVPGARKNAASWVDGSGNLWLFGGYGYASSGTSCLNDLWKFDGSNWTWVSGGNTVDQAGTYGTQGVAAAANVPGARYGAVSWFDGSIMWLFGGSGYDSTGAYGYLNDLWKFDGSNWTWVSGATTISQAGTYGAKGVAAAANVPGARMYAVTWTDSNHNLWLFGGSGPDGYFNDLWKFNGSNWVWMSGANTVGQVGTYGTEGVAAATNVPGAREEAVSWVDGNGNLWLFGGWGYDSLYIGPGLNVASCLNDLWKFDGNNWTWMGGQKLLGVPGTYGTEGVTAAGNFPGIRKGAVSWIDGGGNFWLFGGLGYASNSTSGWLNDLWRYKP